jgi:hypothetical protein
MVHELSGMTHDVDGVIKKCRCALQLHDMT